MLNKLFSKVSHSDSIKTLAIQKNLQMLLEQKQALNMNHITNEDELIMIIHSIDDKYRHLLLEQLVPQSDILELKAGHRLTAHCNLQGRALSFACRYQNLHRLDDALFHRVSFPEAIDICQRRNAFRVTLAEQNIHHIQLENSEIGEANGRLIDISLSGIQAQFPDHIRVSSNSMVSKCQFKMDDEQKLECGLEIRHISYNPEQQYSRVGAQFVGLDTPNERQLSKFVSLLQRSQCRNSLMD